MPWEPRPPLAIPSGVEDELLEVAKRRKAEEEITRKWNSLDGAFGASTGDFIKIGIGYYREYITNGRIYYNYHYGNNAFIVYGAIGDKYTELGGPDSWLGWPTSDEQAFSQDGRASTFEHGAIYWWPDTGAIELGNISVQYKGLYCFGETDEVSASDEPYVILGVVPAFPAQPSSLRTRVYEERGGVDAGNSRPDSIELYRGVPYGMVLGVLLMENDLGDPNKYLEEVSQAVVGAGAAVTTACAGIQIVGPLIALGCAAVFREYADDITNIVNDLLGTGDDLIENWDWHVTAKEMVTMARVPLQNFWGIEYHLESKLLSDGEASYKVYLAIHSA